MADDPGATFPVGLRDWFAGQALAGSQITADMDGLDPGEVGFKGYWSLPSTDIAGRAYEIAAAMLAERAKEGLAAAGLMMVPLEPTQAMVIAGVKAMAGVVGVQAETAVIMGQPRDIYRAMIDAAPGADNV